MADTPGLITVLVAYTAVVLTIVGGILSFMLYHFIPLKSKVDTMWRDLYGGDTGEGELEEAGDERESMRDMLEDARDAHTTQTARVGRLVRYLRDLSEHLDADEYHDDPPHVFDDNYIDERETEGDELYRGDD